MTRRERRSDKTPEARRPAEQGPKKRQETSHPAAAAHELARKAEAIRQAQLDLTVRKLPKLTQEQRDSLDAMTRALVREILREPLERIDGEHDADVVRRLFKLDTEESR